MTETSLPNPLNLLEAFRERHSIRSFQGENLTNEQKSKVVEIINESNLLETPFHSSGVEVSLTGPGLGRLGVISREAGWIVEKLPIQSDSKDEDFERKREYDASYIGQHVVMKLAQNRINTCWIAGTYNEEEAEKRFPGFRVPCTIAFGIEQKENHFVDKLIRFFGDKQGERLPFEELFYDDDNKKNLTENDLNNSNSHFLKDFVVALRSASSAKNQQPWRFILSGKEVHLFDAKFNHFSTFDIGIALANLHLLAEIRGGSVQFIVKNPAPNASPFNGTYIATAVYNE